MIVLSFDHRSFDQLKMSNNSLAARGTNLPFSDKSVVSATLEQNIICSKTLICGQLFAARSRGGLPVNEKEGKNTSHDNNYYLHDNKLNSLSYDIGINDVLVCPCNDVL